MTDKRKECFPQMAMPEANRQCRPFVQEKAIKERCPVCTMQIVLHCEDCKIQVTGCLCTEEANHGEEIARQRMIDRGIWLPAWGDKPASMKPTHPGRLHG